MQAWAAYGLGFAHLEAIVVQQFAAEPVQTLPVRSLFFFFLNTYEFKHVPVEDVVVGEALSVEEVPEELAQVRVVGLVVEAQGAAEVQVGGELGWQGKRKESTT